MFFSHSFRPFPSLHFPSLSPAPRSGPHIQLRDFRSAVSSPSAKKGVNDICRHQARSLGSKYTKNMFAVGAGPQTHFGVFRAQGTCDVSGGCKCRPVSVKRNLHHYFLHFISGEAVLTPKTRRQLRRWW